MTSGSQAFVARPTPFWTFDYNALNRFRAAVFGGLSSTWAESLIECTGYIAANPGDWIPA